MFIPNQCQEWKNLAMEKILHPKKTITQLFLKIALFI